MYSLQYPKNKVGDPLALLEMVLGKSMPADMKRGLRRVYRRYTVANGAACLIKPDKSFRTAHGAALQDAYKQTYEGRSLEWLRTVLQAVAGR